MNEYSKEACLEDSTVLWYLVAVNYNKNMKPDKPKVYRTIWRTNIHARVLVDTKGSTTHVLEVVAEVLRISKRRVHAVHYEVGFTLVPETHNKFDQTASG